MNLRKEVKNVGGLIIRLLTILNTEPEDSTYFNIAEVLLQNYHKIQFNSIDNMASMANISKSTMSKFTRDLGFDDYLHLKDSSNFSELKDKTYYNYTEVISEKIKDGDYTEFFQSFHSILSSLEENIDHDAIKRLADKLVEYKKVGIFGLLFSESTATDFQYKLAFHEKFVYTFQNDLKQNNFILNADEKTLLIIISNSGDFLRYDQMQSYLPKKSIFSDTKAYVFAITSDKNILDLPHVDDAIIYPKGTGMQDHTYIYPVLIDLIVSQYRIAKQNT